MVNSLMYKKYKDTFMVNYTDCDSLRNMKISSLLKYVTIVSYKQSDMVGIDSEFLDNYGGNWVIHELDVSMRKIPQYQDVLTISVYSTTFNKFFMYREIDICSEKEGYIGNIVMSLSLLDINSRKIIMINDGIGESFGAVKSKKIVRFPKKMFFENNSTSVINKVVSFNDLDINKHVSNNVYLDWLIDSLNEEFILNHSLAKLSIRFEHECHLGEKLDIRSTINEFESWKNTYWVIEGNEEIKVKAQAKWFSKNN